MPVAIENYDHGFPKQLPSISNLLVSTQLLTKFHSCPRALRYDIRGRFNEKLADYLYLGRGLITYIFQRRDTPR